MSEKEHDMTNDGGESVTYTLRNIPADTDRVITDLASHARKPKATFLREFWKTASATSSTALP